LKQHQFENWSRQYRCIPHHIYYPTNTQEVVHVIQSEVRQKSRIRAFGAGHSPGDIAMSDEGLIVTTQLNRILAVDPTTKAIAVQSGITLTDLNQVLASYGLALPNLGSISAQTLGGAIATATHGTGLNYGVLSTLIRAMTLVTAEGETVRLSEQENPRFFNAAQCSLGALGVVTELELQVCDAFDLEVFEQPNALETVLEDLPNRLQADHYRFWYLPHADRVWEWSAIRKPPGGAQPRLTLLNRIHQWYQNRLIGYHLMELLLYLATFYHSWIPSINQWYTHQQFATPRQSRSDSVTQFNFDCLFKQHVNEWCIPIQNTAQGILQIRDMIRQYGYQVHLPIEVRFVKGDDIWLSPCQGRDSCYIGVIAYLPYGKPVDYAAYFADYEQIMSNLGGRPHWAKRFGPDYQWLKDHYPHWNDFQAVRTELDPHHCFSNPYTERVLG
jgi:L-gulonolactone oxidase